MKFYTLAAVGFSPGLLLISAQDNFDSSNYDYEDDEPDLKKFSAIMDMTYSKVQFQSPGTKWSAAVFQTRISQYGCHCFLGSSRAAGGKGVPVNELDDSCRTLYRCKKCVSMDTPQGCDVDHDKYKYTFNSADGSIDCSANDNKCKLTTCKCDAQFAAEVADFWDDAKWDDFYWGHRANRKNPNGVYDYDNTCIASGQSIEPNNCCGKNPFRYPYNDQEKSCCAKSGKLYNEVTSECCKDGSVQASCP